MVTLFHSPRMVDMSAEYFAARLRELREAKGWTQQQLADAAGLALAGLANLEQGRRRRPGWDTVVALAEALGVSLDEFVKPPADVPPPKRGRPRKAEDAPEPRKPKRK